MKILFWKELKKNSSHEGFVVHAAVITGVFRIMLAEFDRSQLNYYSPGNEVPASRNTGFS
jgi:hypothetical protein